MLSQKKLLFFIPVILFSCRYKNNAQQNKNSYQLIKSPEQCFKAICQKDSAFLKIKVTPDGKIHGRLTIKYGEPEPLASTPDLYNGEITGEFAKDTLFADYIFTDGARPALYRNPIALLKKDDKLVLGFGVTINYLGRTWFRDHHSINFNNSRFQFAPTECRD